MAKVRLLSVPHSGTRFARDILIRAGLEPVSDFLQQHFTGNHHWILDLDGPVIIPQRKRDAVEASWEKRKSGEVPVNWSSDGDDLDACYAEMNRFIAENDDVFVLNVDDPEVRDGQLKAIGDALGLELSADFSVMIGHNQ